MRVADYIVKKLEEFGVEHAFMITGGGAMHLNDAFGRSERIKCVTPHHEQAVAIAAEGYSRASGKIGVGVVTSGPGGTNTLTGVMGQLTDSVPAIYISGQVKWVTHKSCYPDLSLRQLGDQELDIISVVKSITKFAKVLVDPEEVDLVLGEALELATTGRPGPVWIDVPLNVQGALIDPDKLKKFESKYVSNFEVAAKSGAQKIIEMLKRAERPVISAGNGIRVKGCRNEFLQLIHRLKIPVVTTFNGSDNIPSSDPYYCGRVGSVGDRAGNFAVQNSDLYISFGSRNNIRQISYDWKNFARAAKIVVVDIDEAELNKPTLVPDEKIHSCVSLVIDEISKIVESEKVPDFSDWNNWCQIRKKKYDTVLPEYKEIKNGLHPYVFVRKLTELSDSNSIFVAGNGTACVAMFHASVVKENQKHFWNSGCASMGYDLPAALGAAVANPGSEVICLAGDGSIMMNLQELATIAHSKLPIKVIVLENNGYQSIRQTQRSYFGLPFVGCGPESGVGFPDFVKLGTAFGLDSYRIDSVESMDEMLPSLLKKEGPALIEVVLNRDYIFAPKLSSRKLDDGRMISEPPENMFPFLPREEFLENMIIEPMSENR